MNKSIEVKKLCSLNPTKYKWIKLALASRKYDDYIFACAVQGVAIPKSFINWLETEV